MPTLHVGIRIMPEHNFLTKSQDYAKYYAGIIRQELLIMSYAHAMASPGNQALGALGLRLGSFAASVLACTCR